LQDLDTSNMQPKAEATPQLDSHKINKKLPLMLSVVVTVQNQALEIDSWLTQLSECVAHLVSDYEIIIVDNGSTDETLEILHQLTSEQGMANLQVFSLAGHVDDLTARWVGIENSLGDLVACLDWRQGDLAFLEELVRTASEGYDVVFTRKSPLPRKAKHPNLVLYRAFGIAIRLTTGMAIDSYSTSFIAISRRIVSHLLQYPDPQIKFRNLGSSTGFRRTLITLAASPDYRPNINLRQSIPRGIRLVTSSTSLPMRFATLLSAFCALLSILYSIYIILIWAFKKDVAPGWVSLSMQQSAMFFLISLVLMIMSEYVLEISRKTNSGPSYYIADEFTSARLTRKERLNIEVDQDANTKIQRNTSSFS